MELIDLVHKMITDGNLHEVFAQILRNGAGRKGKLELPSSMAGCAVGIITMSYQN